MEIRRRKGKMDGQTAERVRCNKKLGRKDGQKRVPERRDEIMMLVDTR